MRRSATYCHNSDFSKRFRPLSDCFLANSLKFRSKLRIQTTLRALQRAMTQGHVWNFSLILLRVLKVTGISSARKKIKVICTLFWNLILLEGNDPRSCVKFQPNFAPGFESYGHFKSAKKNKSYLHTFLEPDSCRGQWPKVMCEISALFCSGFWNLWPF